MHLAATETRDVVQKMNEKILEVVRPQPIFYLSPRFGGAR